MRTDERLEQLGYEAGVPKPLFAIIHGDCASAVWRWREAGNFRDLLVDNHESLTDDQLRNKLTQKLKLGLTKVPADPVIVED